MDRGAVERGKKKRRKPDAKNVGGSLMGSTGLYIDYKYVGS